MITKKLHHIYNTLRHIESGIVLSRSHRYLTSLLLLKLFLDIILPPGTGLVQWLFLPGLFYLWTKRNHIMGHRAVTGGILLVFLLTLLSLVHRVRGSEKWTGDLRSLYKYLRRGSRITARSTTGVSTNCMAAKLHNGNTKLKSVLR